MKKEGKASQAKRKSKCKGPDVGMSPSMKGKRSKGWCVWSIMRKGVRVRGTWRDAVHTTFTAALSNMLTHRASSSNVGSGTRLQRNHRQKTGCKETIDRSLPQKTTSLLTCMSRCFPAVPLRCWEITPMLLWGLLQHRKSTTELLCTRTQKPILPRPSPPRSWPSHCTFIGLHLDD